MAAKCHGSIAMHNGLDRDRICAPLAKALRGAGARSARRQLFDPGSIDFRRRVRDADAANPQLRRNLG